MSMTVVNGSAATASDLVNSSSSNSTVASTISDDHAFLNSTNNSSNNNLTASIASIRSNVTRVLYMYFQNATDEYGYGAATATPAELSSLSSASNENTTTQLHASAVRTYSASYTSTSNSSHVTDTPQLMSTSTSAATAHSGLGQRVLDTAKTLLQAPLKSNLSAAASTVSLLPSTATTFNATTSSATTTTAGSTAADILLQSVDAAKRPLAASLQPTVYNITYPPLAIRSQEDCSALFSHYTQPQHGVFCNWTWDQFLCWPPTPAGAVAHMNCPPAGHGIDTKKFANRKCELDGRWGVRPNDIYNPVGYTDYKPCFKPEVNELLNQMKDIDILLDIARRTRTLEIIGLIISLLALILSLIIFYNFSSLRNNRTKIHKNLFIAMVFQVVIRLTLYLDQAFRRGSHASATNTSMPGIENIRYLCEASYVLLEYARTAMFMWMFIEGLYLHNMVTVAVFQNRFPHTIFTLLGWGAPVVMTTVWAICTVIYTDSVHDCLWNYNLTPYYWILEGPRLIVILLNFFFLMNIIRVLVMKLRQSQASEIEQSRKAVRAAIVLLPLLGITNLLHLVPAINLNPPWKFALWSYVTHFLTSFQGFFIALIYCFLNGEVRIVLLKSLAVYMSVRGHPEWAPKRASMFSGAYNTAPDTEGQIGNGGTPQNGTRNENASPTSRRLHNGHGARKYSTTVNSTNAARTGVHITARRLSSGGNTYRQQRRRRSNSYNNNNNGGLGGIGGSGSSNTGGNWLLTLCFGGPKNKCVMSTNKMPTNIFMTTKPTTKSLPVSVPVSIPLPIYAVENERD